MNPPFLRCCQASGPPVEGSGYFYDAFIGSGSNSIPVSTKTLHVLETSMRKLSAAAYPFERCRVAPSAAAAMFAGNIFKLRVIEAASARGEQLTVYRCGPFVDLCRYHALNYAHTCRCRQIDFPLQGSPRVEQRGHWRCYADVMLGSASSAASAVNNGAVSACQRHGCPKQIATCRNGCRQSSSQGTRSSCARNIYGTVLF